MLCCFSKNVQTGCSLRTPVLLQEAFLAALSQPRQEHRVDDVLLEQARSGNLDASGELHDLDPEQLQSLKFEREISKHNAAVSAVARAVGAPHVT